MYVMIGLTLLCVIVLYILKLNKNQETERLLYEHKFIPVPLKKYVNKKR
ncbi:Ac110 [Cnaphalocrocis medinalis granulovirus]|uniref:Ac110 n=1 Tax=Cnaphalocrocis medinalis granulovirus TaxID=1750712 RepID=A0A109WW44_9BBAC|nr:Ac110 [Cnaphalocrocis medinalis granulovirus]AMF83786.1 Ac110 [Cnaphalocrocis medinalis granulovirus]WPN08665.1 Ac110 [Cnaphalocrocis medinalis granulovirus]